VVAATVVHQVQALLVQQTRVVAVVAAAKVKAVATAVAVL
jgi:hypothetical protein